MTVHADCTLQGEVNNKFDSCVKHQEEATCTLLKVVCCCVAKCYHPKLFLPHPWCILPRGQGRWWCGGKFKLEYYWIAFRERATCLLYWTSHYDRMHWIKIESGAEDGEGLFSEFDRMSFSTAAFHYPTCMAVFEAEVHLVNVECEIRIHSSTTVINILYFPSADLMSAALPAGLLFARKHASLCHTPTVK